jgi:signal transduction histidine kinase
MRNRLVFLFLSFIFWFTLSSSSQVPTIDSIQSLISASKNDTSKISPLNELSIKIFNTEPAKALLLAKQAQLIAEQENYFAYSPETNNAIAASSWLLGNYDDAVEYIHKNIAIYEKENDQENLADSYHHLSIVFAATSQEELALEYIQKAISICKNHHYDSILARSKNLAAMIYIDFKNDYDSAEIYFNDALKIYTKLSDTLKIGSTESNLAIIYFHNKQYDRALKAYKNSLKTCIKYKSNSCVCTLLNNMGNVYSELKQYGLARSYYQQSLDTSMSYQLKSAESRAYYELAVIDSLQGNYLSAIDNFQKHYNLQNDLLSTEKEKKIAELQIIYELDKEKQENALLKKNERLQTLIVRLLGGAILLILIVLLFLWHLLQTKQKSNISLNKKNEEIIKQKDEINLQKEKVQSQTKELYEYKGQLEKLVKKRTEELLVAKEHAEESDRLKTAFLNNISHEYRTPMNGILGFSNLLIDTDTSNEERAEYTKLIRRSCDKLLNLVVDTVEISKIHSKQEEIIKSPVNIQDIISIVLSNHTDEMTNKGLHVKLELDCTQEQFVILTDKSKLTRIFGHLIDNAVKFTHQGFISLYCEVVDGFLQFQIEDSGIGLSKELIAKVFEPFRQEEPNSVRNYGGSGIGLTLVKSYIELLNGEIWIESELAKGTSVFFTLPMETTLDDLPKPKLKDIQILRKKTILVAEDNEMNFVLIEKLLSPYDCRILQAWNGKEAVDYFVNDKQVDIVLMDLRMPVVDGYTAAKLIKEMKPHIPIIAQTAYTQNRVVNKAQLVNFDGFISKPIDIKKLISEIMKHV